MYRNTQPSHSVAQHRAFIVRALMAGGRATQSLSTRVPLLALVLLFLPHRHGFLNPAGSQTAPRKPLGLQLVQQKMLHPCPRWGQVCHEVPTDQFRARRWRHHVPRRAFGGGLELAVPLVAVFGVLALALQSYDDTQPIKDFIMKYTDIEIVDTPLPPQPAAFEATVDGYWKQKEKRVKWYIKSDDVYRRILLQGGLGLGEAYMDGLWECNDIEELCGEFLKLEQVEKGGSSSSSQRFDLGWKALPFVFSCGVGMLKAAYLPSNTKQSSKENIEAHYDIGTDLYSRMLGRMMNYSCGYFCRPGMSVDEAQLAKMSLAARKLDLKPGMRVLDVGCGYGTMAHHIASTYGVHVVGVTISKDQFEYQKRYFAHPNVEIRLMDYRDLKGETFDRVYSIGIFEHIGRQNYETYFDKCYDLLVDDGIMLIHTIGWGKTGPWNPNTFMFKYIFPGAEIPHMSHFGEVFTDRWHLEDWQSFGKSYPRTGRAWLANLGSWEGLEKYDERFRRMWWYYILSCCASFERRRCKLWQLVYTKTNSSRPDDCHHIRMRPAVEMNEVLLSTPEPVIDDTPLLEPAGVGAA